MNFRPVVFFVICRAAGCYRYFSPMVQPTGLQVQAAYACSSVSGIAMSWVPIVYMPLASLRSADEWTSFICGSAMSSSSVPM